MNPDKVKISHALALAWATAVADVERSQGGARLVAIELAAHHGAAIRQITDELVADHDPAAALAGERPVITPAA